jgi:hypothetical protein
MNTRLLVSLATCAAAHVIVVRSVCAQTSAPPAAAVTHAVPKDSVSVPDKVNPRAVQPERPTVATHAGNVAPGYVEVESGVEQDRIAAGVHATQVPTVIKFGVVHRVQFSLSLPVSGGTGESLGIGDVSAGVKWRFLEDHPLLSDVAIQPTVKFSSGGQRGTGTTDLSLLLIDSHVFAGVSVDLNVGVTRRSGDGETAPKTATLWAAASGFPVAGNLSFALELFGNPGTGGPAGSAPTVALLAGPTYLVRPELNLDVGIIEPVSGPQPRAVYAGVVVNLGRLPFVRGQAH